MLAFDTIDNLEQSKTRELEPSHPATVVVLECKNPIEP